MILIAATVWLATIYKDATIKVIKNPISSDFYKFYLSAQRHAQGISPYWPPPSRTQAGDPCHPENQPPPQDKHLNTPSGTLPHPVCLGPNLSTPFVVMLMQPLALLDFPTAWLFWCNFSLACSLLAAFLLFSQDNKKIRCAILCVAIHLYFPTIANFALGQVGSILFLLLVISWRTLRKGNHMLSGIALGIAISLKPFIAIICVLIAINPTLLRLTTAAVLTGGFCSLLGALFIGKIALLDYINCLTNITWSGSNWNGSWLGVAERFFSGAENAQLLPASLPARMWSTVASLMTIGIAIYAILVAKKQGKNYANASFTLGISTALLVSPLGWSYYFTSLAIPFYCLSKEALARQEGRFLLYTLSAPLAISATPSVLKSSPYPGNPSSWIGPDSAYFLSLIILFTLSIVASFKGQKKSAP